MTAVNTVVRMVGKLISYWDMPLFSMSSMDHTLRDPWDYSTLVRVSTPSDRFATALLMFCHHNDVSVLCTLLLGEEASPSNGNTLWRVSAMFTHLAITPPEVNGFG